MYNFCVYILFSPTLDSYYVGYTRDIALRLEQHNLHLFKGSFTGRASDWEVFFEIRCRSESQAIRIERHIKRNRSRKLVSQILNGSSEEMEEKQK